MSGTSLQRRDGRGATGRDLIDSRRLLYFFHVAKAGRFTAAEAILDVAQSAMSRQIQQLEADLGVQLLDRTGRGVKLTEFGQILYRKAEAILRTMAETVEEIDEARLTPLGTVSIAAPPTFTTAYMSGIVERFTARCAGVRLRVVEASTGGVYSLLTDGTVDTAVVLQPVSTGRLEIQALMTDQLALIATPKHKISRLKSVPREELRNIELVLPASLHGTRAILSAYFAPGDIPLRSQVEVDSLSLMLDLVRKGRFCAILPHAPCREDLESGQLISRPLRPNLTRTLYLASVKDGQRSEIKQALIDCVVEAVQARIGVATP